VKKAFRSIAKFIQEENIEEVAVSYMCSGTERLHRLFTMDLLYNELKDVPVKVHYYNKFPSRRWKGAGDLFQDRQQYEQALGAGASLTEVQQLQQQDIVMEEGSKGAVPRRSDRQAKPPKPKDL